MQGKEQVINDIFEGLSILSKRSFPKTCPGCGKTYASVEDFITQTEGVAHQSGLSEYMIKRGKPFVALFRNCPCGSTMMEKFKDRRDTSSKGIENRNLFMTMLDSLIALGLSRDVAHQELLKVLEGQQSEILFKLFLPE